MRKFRYCADVRIRCGKFHACALPSAQPQSQSPAQTRFALYLGGEAFIHVGGQVGLCLSSLSPSIPMADDRDHRVVKQFELQFLRLLVIDALYMHASGILLVTEGLPA